MEVKLLVIGGKHPGQAIPVQGPKFFIGRAEDCQLRPRSEMVSRHHCAILLEEGFVAVRDFGSKNGTFVNGERVKSEQELKAGDRLKVGPLEFEVHLGVSLSGKKKPKVHSVQEAAARTVESATDKDDDVASWLADDEETITGDSVRATTVIPPARPAPTPAVVPPAPVKAAAPDALKPAKPEPVVAPSPTPKPAVSSSRSAAADTLKQMFKRRP